MKKILIIGIVIILLSFCAYLTHLREQSKKQFKNQTPVVTSQPEDNPPVEYDKNQTQKMLDFVDHRRPFSSTDQQARNGLTKFENPLIETSDYSTEYVSEPDEFMVEIRTININKAKAEATLWFQKRGLSHEGICHLPVVFYLNSDTAEGLRGMQIQFDPLPLEC